jgi:hypothetical protein
MNQGPRWILLMKKKGWKISCYCPIKGREGGAFWRRGFVGKADIRRQDLCKFPEYSLKFKSQCVK